MSGNNGWGATRGGRLPRGKPFHVPSAPGLASAARIAIQAHEIAAQLDMPVVEVLERMRHDELFECDDEAFKVIVGLATIGHQQEGSSK